MELHMSGNTVYLAGEWTIAKMTFSNIDAVAVSLEQMGFTNKKSLLVDCGELNMVDDSGLQFINIWLHCLRFRGVEPELVNLSGNLHKLLQNSGFRNSSSDNCSVSAEKSALYSHRKRRFVNESRYNQGNCQTA